MALQTVLPHSMPELAQKLDVTKVQCPLKCSFQPSTEGLDVAPYVPASILGESICEELL